MFDDIHAYFIENVRASYAEYKKRRNESKAGQNIDLRKSLAAANSLYHFREHLPNKYKKSRKELSQLCSDYDLLGDIVNASKHNILTKNWKFLNTAKNISEQIIMTRYQDSEGEYFNREKIICVKLIDGSERDLFDVLTNVLNMWYTYLFEIGILQNENKEVIIKPKQPIRRNEATGNKLDFEHLQGVRSIVVAKLQEYNYTTNRIENVNLDDGKVEMIIYKPKYEVELKLIHKETKKEIIIPINLTEDEMLQMDQLKNDSEIKVFLFNLTKKQGIIKSDSSFNEKETEIVKIK